MTHFFFKTCQSKNIIFQSNNIFLSGIWESYRFFDSVLSYLVFYIYLFRLKAMLTIQHLRIKLLGCTGNHISTSPNWLLSTSANTHIVLVPKTQFLLSVPFSSKIIWFTERLLLVKYLEYNPFTTPALSFQFRSWL